MAEFNLNAFSDSLIDLFTNSNLFPYSQEYYIDKNGKSQPYSSKHKNRQPLHLKDAVIHSISQSRVFEQDMNSFEIGNEQMEIMHPYFHILNDSPYIRKRNMGSDKTHGSQAKVEKGKRDYNVVAWNGKTFVKEYQRNVRGSRNRTNKVSHWITNSNGEKEFINRDSNTYVNEHYHYIEKILDNIVDDLASMYGLKAQRKVDSGLGEEYASQFEDLGLESNILDIISSFD